MYAPIVQAGGGRDHVIAQAQAAAIGAQATMVSFEAIKPFRRISGSKNDYVVVPTHTILEIEGNRYASESFELAIRPHEGGTWQYLDGSGLTPNCKPCFAAICRRYGVSQASTSLVDAPKADPSSTPETQPDKADSGPISEPVLAGKPNGMSSTFILTLVAVGLSACFIIVLTLSLSMRSAPKNFSRLPTTRVPPMK